MVMAATGNWLELKVVCDADVVEDVAELFSRYGFNQGVVIEEASLQDGAGDAFAVAPAKPVTVSTWLGAGDATLEQLEDIRSTLWVLRQYLWILGRSRPVGAVEIVERPEEDWDNAWKSNFSAHRVGKRVVVKAAWHDYAPLPDETVIELDPGTAFGTGRHASTRLCLEALEEELEAGDRVLDVGIGSGVLATAAALLGARAVDGLDIDPAAIRAARENADRNGVGEIVRVALGTIGPAGPFPGPFDLVVANIIASVLIELASALVSTVAPGGTLILGGIIDSKEASVHEAFAAANLSLVCRKQREDWVALVWRTAEDMSGTPDA